MNQLIPDQHSVSTSEKLTSPRIGFDARMAGFGGAGIARYAYTLLLHLLHLHAKSAQWFVFYHPQTFTEAQKNELLQYGATLIAAPYRHYSINEQMWFSQLLNHYNLDLVHFPNFNVPRLYRRPFVVTIHDMVHHVLGGHKKSRLLWFYGYKYIIQQAARRAQAILTVSEHSKTEIAKYLEVPPSKIFVTHLAPFITSPINQACVNKVRTNFLIQKPYFLFVGTLEKKKNAVFLAQAFNDLITHTKLDMELVFAGKIDPHYPEAKELILSLRHASRIIFTGLITDDELQALYTGAFAFVTFSQFEGFGLPALEAMQLGIPVVAADTPVYREIYSDAAVFANVTQLTAARNALTEVATNKTLYTELQNKGVARAKAFDWYTTAEKTWEVYKHALQ